MNGSRCVKGLFFAAAAALVAAGGIFSYAALTSFLTAETTLSTDKVDIRVESYTDKEGRAAAVTDEELIGAGDTVSYIPRIENLDERAYVRAEMTAVRGAESVDLMSSLYGIGDGWKLSGGYLYYTEPLETGEAVELCEGFTVPESWNSGDERNVSVRVGADAVQAKNFMPDFAAAEPWGDVEAEISESLDTASLRTAVYADGGIAVAYDDEAGIEIDVDEFPEDISFMPGDVYGGSIRITNLEDKPASVFLKVECGDESLADMLDMRIDNGRTVYSGSVRERAMLGFQQLVALEAGEARSIDISMSLADEADNGYSLREASQTWIFATENESPATGDGGAGAAAAVCCAAAAAIILLRKKNDEKS